MRLTFLIFFLPISFFGQHSIIDWVDPFIGTGGHGHTFPGATMPFGMVQLSPDTRIEGWDGCSGYHYSDSIIYGFSHTHLSGTGVADYGDLLIMPTQGEIEFNNGKVLGSEKGYGSIFNKSTEKASPGYYQVKLEEDDIDVRLTTTDRVGFHEYTFNNKGAVNLIIDLEHRDQLLDWNINKISDKEVVGYRISHSWAEEQHFYFVLQTSQSIDNIKEMRGTGVYHRNEDDVTKMALGFKKPKKGKIMVKVGISAVSIEGARRNLQKEAIHWDFDNYKSAGQDIWVRALSKIKVNGGTDDQKTIFYTALYHSMIAPNLFSDVDGNYRGTDLQVHHADKTAVYTIFSLWDTFRATHPLYTIIEQERTRDFIATFLRNYKDGGQLPVWELSANYTGCMIGYHAVSVILDAYVKGIELENEMELLNAMTHIAERDQLGIPYYKYHGYIPAESETESVSKTLEYAYNDWCIAQMADELGVDEVFNRYIERAQYYKNIFNPSSGFMQAKFNGSWQYGFKPEEVNFNFTEANSWQYSMFVPQDIDGLVKLHGGNESFELKLDQLFETSSTLSGRHQSDITGMIGQYAHGNEPSHHMAYLYNYVGKPHKTQARVAQILNEQYTSEPDGLSGNEDCGQMSSWYVLSALGFYSVTPGIPYYAIGSPIFDEVDIQLENGNHLKIVVKRQTQDDIYIQELFLNERMIEIAFLSHELLMNGGELRFVMGPKPNKELWKKIPAISYIEEDYSITSVPYYTSVKPSFVDSLKVELKSVDDKGDVFYKQKQDSVFQLYKSPFYIHRSRDFEAYAQIDNRKSKIVKASYFKIDGGRQLNLFQQYDNQYNGGGDDALIDGLKGPNNFMTGFWQGYQGEDFSAVVDLGQEKKINYISLGVLQDIKSWIFYPREISFYASNDNVTFNKIATVKNNFSDKKYGSFIQDLEYTLKETISCKYIKVEAINYGPCPDWHLGKGGKTWLFLDEITIK